MDRLPDVSPFAPEDLISVSELLPDGVVVADAEGRVTYANSMARRLIGETLEEGRHLRAALALQDHDSQDWFDAVDPYGGLGTRSRIPEQAWIPPTGEEVLLTVRLHRTAPNEPVHTVAIVIRSARGRERLDRERSDLVAAVAHELRSPLTGVKGFVTTLLNNWERFNDEQKKLMLTTVSADSERLQRLITELLDVARIDTGRLPLYPREVDLDPIVERVLASVRVATTRPLVHHQGADLPPLHADPDKLVQVVTNLVDNAVRHGEGTVRVTTEVYDGAVRFHVDDDGEGIPEGIRTRVFTKFWKHGARGGTGLGMYIVNGLVRAHGGELSIGESPSGGARISIVWPAAASSNESGSSAGSPTS